MQRDLKTLITLGQRVRVTSSYKEKLNLKAKNEYISQNVEQIIESELTQHQEHQQVVLKKTESEVTSSQLEENTRRPESC